MAFDRSMPAPLILSPAPKQFQNPAPAPTILERVAVREAQLGIEAPLVERNVTFADVLFGALMTALTVAAALAGVTAAVFLIGMGFAIYVVPVIAAVGLSVTFFSAALLVFRKEIRLLATRIAQKAKHANTSADLFQTA